MKASSLLSVPRPSLDSCEGDIALPKSPYSAPVLTLYTTNATGLGEHHSGNPPSVYMESESYLPMLQVFRHTDCC